jgi:hypothetical protein
MTARPILRLLALMFCAHPSALRKPATGGNNMKADIYEQVTDRIITQLEQGVVPWKSP